MNGVDLLATLKDMPEEDRIQSEFFYLISKGTDVNILDQVLEDIAFSTNNEHEDIVDKVADELEPSDYALVHARAMESVPLDVLEEFWDSYTDWVQWHLSGLIKERLRKKGININ
jgi:hypothetical protein